MHANSGGRSVHLTTLYGVEGNNHVVTSQNPDGGSP